MRSRLALGAVLVVMTGCDTARVRQIRDAGSVCLEGEELINGECRVVCHRDGDCAAGERCNLLVGRCEPKPPPPDAGGEVVRCTEGAVRCAADGKSVQRCDATGSFVAAEACASPEGYCENERCLSCRPGTARCTSANQAEVCKSDGSGYRQVACSAGATCSQGLCSECEVGQRRCGPGNTTLEVCEAATDETKATRFVPGGDNFDGTCITQVCQVTNGTAQCKAPACLPGAQRCADTATQQICSATGAWTDVRCSAQPGMGATAECLNGACVDECGDAVRAKSYFGCEYWTGVMDNGVDPLFKAGTLSGQGTADSELTFVVTNQSTLPATVEVWRHRSGAPVKVKTVTVPGRNDASKGLVRIPVPWQSVSPHSSSEGITGVARYGYRLTSTRPVTVYQFNPADAIKVTSKSCSAAAGDLDCGCNESAGFECGDLFCFSCSSPGTCTQTTAGKRCGYNAFTNDASLLLPAHILGTSYVGLTPGYATLDLPSPNADFNYTNQLVIVAPSDGTSVTIKAASAIRAGTVGASFGAMARGETRTITLNSYEMLQLTASNTGSTNLECGTATIGSSSFPACRTSSDLTGTIVTSSKPIALFGAAPCLQVPYTRYACDHVEEQLFPFSTWGKLFVAVPSHPLRLNNQSFATSPVPDHYKIVAGTSTQLTITPPPSAANVLAPTGCTTGTLAANTCVLPAGGYVEFKSTVPFSISANNPVSVAQFFPGQGATSSAATSPEQGDPSMVLLPPVEQWRSRYTVLASTSFKDNYLGLSIDTARVESVRVDGSTVSGFSAISGTSFSVVNHPVGKGTHTIEVVPKQGQLTLPGAGVTVYGYDAYVSYGYTGGLDLTTIVTGVTPGG